MLYWLYYLKQQLIWVNRRGRSVYGHGLVNLSAAVTLQGNVSLIIPLASGAITLIVSETTITAAASTVTIFSDFTVTSTIDEVYLSLHHKRMPETLTGLYELRRFRLLTGQDYVYASLMPYIATVTPWSK